MNPAYIVLAIAIAAILKAALYILKEYERGVILRLGRYSSTRGPGWTAIIPFVDKLYRVDLRTVPWDVPPQDVITKDNVSIKVNAVLYFRVVDAAAAILKIENYVQAVGLIAQTTLRSVCGQAELDELLSKRDEINDRVQDIIDRETDPWGIKVSGVEIKDIDLPQEMRRAMAKQAEAERERRAKIIQAEGEFQASEKLAAAAGVLSTQSGALHLRYLETLKHIAAEHNSTILFPLPLELFEVFRKKEH